jgi:hypothetical protein
MPRKDITMKDERTKYIEELSAHMVEWDMQIDRIKGQAENANAEAKFAVAKSVSALQLKRNQAAEKLRGIGMASEHDWEDMKEGVEQIWDEVKELLRDAIKKTR